MLCPKHYIRIMLHHSSRKSIMDFCLFLESFSWIRRPDRDLNIRPMDIVLDTNASFLCPLSVCVPFAFCPCRVFWWRSTLRPVLFVVFKTEWHRVIVERHRTEHGGMRSCKKLYFYCNVYDFHLNIKKSFDSNKNNCKIGEVSLPFYL